MFPSITHKHNVGRQWANASIQCAECMCIACTSLSPVCLLDLVPYHFTIHKIAAEISGAGL